MWSSFISRCLSWNSMVPYILHSSDPKPRTIPDLFHQRQVSADLIWDTSHFLCFEGPCCYEQTLISSSGLLWTSHLNFECGLWFLTPHHFWFRFTYEFWWLIALVYSQLLLTHFFYHLKVSLCLFRCYFHNKMLMLFCAV